MAAPLPLSLTMFIILPITTYRNQALFRDRRSKYIVIVLETVPNLKD